MSRTKRIDLLDKNAIINGNFDFWQRGTSFTSGDNYTADRWLAGDNAGSSSFNVSQSIDVPNSDSDYSMRLEVLTSTTLGANDVLRIQHSLEGRMFKPFFGKKTRISFWVKSSLVGTYCVGLVGDLGAPQRRGYCSEYTINVADTWERKEILVDFTGELPANFQINSVNKSFDLIFGLAAGSGRQFSTLDAWHDVTTLAAATANTVDWQSTVGNTFYLSQVMMHEDFGETQDFRSAGRDYAEELQLCQRYFWSRNQPAGTYPQAIGSTSSNVNDNRFFFLTPVTMRDIPVISIVSGTVLMMANGNTRNVTSIAGVNLHPEGVSANVAHSSTSLGTNQPATLLVGGDRINFDAEL